MKKVKNLLLVALLSVHMMVLSQDFTMVVLPDIQNLTWAPRDQYLYNEMQYIIDNKSNLNVMCVASLGDYTADGYTAISPESQWTVARNSVNMILNANIPYSVCMGNHDMDKVPDYGIPMTMTRFVKYFPVSDFQSKPYFGSYFRNMANNYTLYSQSGMDFIVLSLQSFQESAYDPAVATWANDVLTQYSNRRAIIVTHMLNPGNEYMNNIITKHDNVFLAVYGHDCGDGGERNWTATTPSGNTIRCIMTDYQCRADGGPIVRLYTFKPTENKVYARTYDTKNKYFLTAATSQFTFDYNMDTNVTKFALSQTSEIYEGAENGKTITVTLSNDAFTANLTQSNWNITNLPTGVTVDNIVRNSSTQATITLKGNSTIGSYSTNITNVTVAINGTEFTLFNKTATQSTGITLSKAPITIPGKVEAELYTDSYSIINGQYDKTIQTENNGQSTGYFNDNGEWKKFKINASVAGTYTFSMRYLAGEDGTIGISVNGGAEKAVLFTKNSTTTNWWETTFANWGISAPIQIDLPQGVIEIAIYNKGQDVNTDWYNFEITTNTPGFTFGVIPDIQNMSTSDTEVLKVKKMLGYYITNKAALNLKFVASLGDNIYGYDVDATFHAQYQRIKPAFDDLKNAGIPYSPCAGNHDAQTSQPYYPIYNQYFPISEVAVQNPYYAGYYSDHLKGGSQNAYYLFEELGLKFVVVVLEPFDEFIGIDKKITYNTGAKTWANSILQQYADRRAILVTHDIFEPSGYNHLINDVVKQNDNLFMVVAGHSCSRVGFNGKTGTEQYWTETTKGGNTVHCIMSNYQCDADKGATIRYYTFKPSENKIYAYTWNATTETFKTAPSSQFVISYAMISAPVITNISKNLTTVKPENSVVISSIITDNQIVASAKILWGTTSGVLSNQITMSGNGNTYSGTIPPQVAGTTIYYKISATDNENNTNISTEQSYLVESLSISSISWNSYDIQMNSTITPQASVTSSGVTIPLQFYESTNNDGVDKGAIFTTYSAATHSEAFNNANKLWYSTSYPYVAISTVARGSDVGETNTPLPSGKYDLMMHPADNDHLTVCEASIPLAGNYEISNLATRRVSSNGGNSIFKVFDNNKSLITTLTATNSRAWVTNNQVYKLNNLQAGSKIYFACDRDVNFDYDPTEVVWTLTYIDIPTSVESKSRINEIKIHPNPTQSNTILIVDFVTPSTTYSIYSMCGSLIEKGKITSNTTEISTEKLQNGIYIIKIDSENYSSSIKLIKR